MPRRVTPPPDLIHELAVLVKAHHPLIVLETSDDTRAETIIEHAGAATSLPVYRWRAHIGLWAVDATDTAKPETKNPSKALAAMLGFRSPALFDLGEYKPFLESAESIAQLKEIHERFFDNPSAAFFTSPTQEAVPQLASRLTWVDAGPPTDKEYFTFINELIADLRTRVKFQVEVTGEDVQQMIDNLSGMTFHEVKKVLSKSIIEYQALDQRTVQALVQARSERVARLGIFELIPKPTGMGEIAGLAQLKKWLLARRAVFREPKRAVEFGLSAPKGILLLGVQGCGKSLSAKAVGREWGLPLLRFDPARVFSPYLGETEQSFRKAMTSAEDMAPVVLWIDELEKAFASGDRDGGTTKRILGSFLHWLQEKPDGVFVVATSNEIRDLPPELLRKGRFDEIFFVDLPNETIRQEILSIHLKRRKRDPGKFNLPLLATVTSGFTGAEIEQAVVSALYTAFNEQRDLDQETLLKEISATRPLSVTMGERIEELRDWARDRTVQAD